MISNKQIALYKSILKEIVQTNINIIYEGYIFKPLLNKKEGKLEDKIKAYHLYFKAMSFSYPKGKKIVQLDNQEFNLFLEEIRNILSLNNYVLKLDIKNYEQMIKESKKILDFKHFLK